MDDYSDNGWKWGVAAIAIVALLLGVALVDTFFGSTVAYPAIVESMHADTTGGFAGGVLYTAVLDINGVRHAIYVKHSTDFYRLYVGQSVTLYRKTGLFTGWWVSDRIEP